MGRWVDLYLEDGCEMKNLILIILLSFLVTSFAFGQECPPLDNINPESLCTASDGTDGVLIFGDCYSIANTTEISHDIFQGTAPTEALGWYAGDTIPREIGLLTNLTTLMLRGAMRTTEPRIGNVIPAEICHLTNLEILDLTFNALGCHDYTWWTINWSIGYDNCNETCEESGECSATIPPEIGYLTNLQALRLSDNHLSGEIPSSIENLVNIRSFGLSENDLTGSIPPEIGNLTLAHVLALDHNQFTGPIPSTIGNMTNLGVWDENWYNPLMGGPDGMGMDIMYALNLSVNQLTGPIPPEIGNLTSIPQVDLSHNQFTGPIPSEMGNMESLIIMDLRWNNLSGLIPPELGNLPNGGHNEFLFDLRYNNLRGQIPEELCNLDNVGLSGNNLCPPYPDCYEGLGDYITCNPYPDCPNGYTAIANTPPINYYSCQIYGSPYMHFKEYDGYCFNQEDLDVLQDFIDVNESFNGLEPLELGAQRWYGGPYGIGRLSLLNFSDEENVISDYNQHAGNNVITTIPESISNLDYLGAVNFSNTQITSMPTSISELNELRAITWNDGQLEGSIPPELGNMNNLISLQLQNNQLTGSIPEELGYLNLMYLWLKKNQLTGEVPLSIWTMDAFYESGEPFPRRISLRENELTGIIPEDVCDLDLNWNNYNYIDIRNNQFCPPYPSCLENRMGQQDDSNCAQASIIEDIMPITYHLYSAYPNPFNPITTLDYDLPEDVLVNITIYDMMGRVVKTMVNSQQNAGFKSLRWNATNDKGALISAGLYLYTIQAGEFRKTKKMVLLK